MHCAWPRATASWPRPCALPTQWRPAPLHCQWLCCSADVLYKIKVTLFKKGALKANVIGYAPVTVQVR